MLPARAGPGHHLARRVPRSDRRRRPRPAPLAAPGPRRRRHPRGTRHRRRGRARRRHLPLPRTGTGLDGLSLQVRPGERLAVVGPSGSGKSTLARLLEREIDPGTGRLQVDDVDLRDYTRRARSRSVVVVPQDPTLFAWTVRDNLRLYRPEATDAEIERACTVADVHDVVRALPAGYDTVLAENGEQLSGGQRQRLAIARGLLSPAPVLVLDEVTSALDPDTERRVMDAVAAASPHRTTVLIAHRESACVHADRWVALRDGRAVAYGDGPPTLPARTASGVR
ncbi:ABC transporter ATP-binding protein [Promicromonospora aerolata]|uniref:ABC transporter ATP-binding protein n=1 Tax=Promicromonospora aerolata TaxID=195749 RepID=A0ABW4V4L5_9MICO